MTTEELTRALARLQKAGKEFWRGERGEATTPSLILSANGIWTAQLLVRPGERRARHHIYAYAAEPNEAIDALIADFDRWRASMRTKKDRAAVLGPSGRVRP